MRVAVVYFPAYAGDQVSRLSQSLAQGMESQGHQVDLIDGSTDENKKLIIYHYIAVGTVKTSFLATKAKPFLP